MPLLPKQSLKANLNGMPRMGKPKTNLGLALGSALAEWPHSYDSKSRLTKDDAAEALKVAQRIWTAVSDEIKAILPKYLDNVMEVWKWDAGEVVSDKNIVENLFQRKLLEGDERLERLEKLKPWECTPSWVNPNPIALFRHIWVNQRENFASVSVFDCFAWLIIFCGEQKRADWFPEMISTALWLLNIKYEVLDEAFQSAWPKLKTHGKQSKGLKAHQASERARVSIRQQQTIAQADKLLSEGKEFSLIVGIIHKVTGQSRKVIRSDLEGHPSKHWLPKRKKKK